MGILEKDLLSYIESKSKKNNTILLFVFNIEFNTISFELENI